MENAEQYTLTPQEVRALADLKAALIKADVYHKLDRLHVPPIMASDLKYEMDKLPD